jgi:hypothetical protein
MMSGQADQAYEDEANRLKEERRLRASYDDIISRTNDTVLQETLFSNEPPADPDASLDSKQLLACKLGNQLNRVQDKPSEKHQHKSEVLKTALKVLHGKAEINMLEAALIQHAHYNKTAFAFIRRSRTEQLVHDVLAIKK